MFSLLMFLVAIAYRKTNLVPKSCAVRKVLLDTMLTVCGNTDTTTAITDTFTHFICPKKIVVY